MFVGRQKTELCSIEHCFKRLKSKGLCSAHYETKRLTGDPLGRTYTPFIGSDIERFWYYIQKTETCWLWQGGLNGKGYGAMKTDHCRTDNAHTFAYRTFKGEIPKGMCVCHTCDVRNCANPDHLFLGTIADNNADKLAKGRNFAPKGSANGFAKLTEDAVREIRDLHKQGATQKAIANQFGVSTYPISEIVHDRAWRHVV